MEEIKILETKEITDNSEVSIISISGVRYAFTEAKYSGYNGHVSIHTNLIKL